MPVLFYGENSYGIRLRIEQYAKDFDEIIYIDCEGNPGASELFATNMSASLFAAKELKVIKHLWKSKNKKLQEEVLGNLADGTLADIVFWEASPDKRSKLYKAIAADGEVFEINFLNNRELCKWLVDEAVSQGISLNGSMAEQIIQIAGNDQINLQNEIQKLIMHAKSYGRNEITKDDLVLLSPAEQSIEIWSLLDAISSGNRKLALQITNQMLAGDENFAYITTMVARQLKIMIIAKQYASNAASAASALKISPYSLRGVVKSLHKFDLDSLKKFFGKVCELDFAIKEGRIDAKIGLNLLVISLPAR